MSHVLQACYQGEVGLYSGKPPQPLATVTVGSLTSTPVYMEPQREDDGSEGWGVWSMSNESVRSVGMRIRGVRGEECRCDGVWCEGDVYECECVECEGALLCRRIQ